MVDTLPIVEPEQFHFDDDGSFPNSQLPALVYRQPLGSDTTEIASAFEERFAENNWTNSWRNGVYGFAHFHSTTHEVLAVYLGRAVLRLGGPKNGSKIDVAKGDVVVIPAGVAHEEVVASDDFGVVGAYPDGREWDVLRGLPGERPDADQRITALPLPAFDPIYGIDGPLKSIWKK